MSTEKFSLKGKVAVVTGALGLLGRQHCDALAEAGAIVVPTDMHRLACEHMAKDFPEGSFGYKLDVTSPESVVKLRNKIISRLGRIDILVNNAAVNDMFEDPKAALEDSKFENYTLENWQRSIDVNLTGVFLCAQTLGKTMAEQGSGSIINIASTYGITAPDQSLYLNDEGEQVFYKPPAYSVTKGGVLMFTRYLAAYWGNKGVRVNALSPGGVQNGQDDFFVESYSKRTPLRRMAKPADYRGALVFLAGDTSSYMTGANLVVDGGWTIW